MASSLSRDIAHTEVTDHRILRHAAVSPQLLEGANVEPQLGRDGNPASDSVQSHDGRMYLPQSRYRAAIVLEVFECHPYDVDG